MVEFSGWNVKKTKLEWFTRGERERDGFDGGRWRR